uniref:F-box only protein 22 n=1 Tax=Petromyzon marinus TaxID=7757 RepID=A0AAJ7SJY4_PETMA|nr:F-box only protein 22 [Petromyzon marinus]
MSTRLTRNGGDGGDDVGDVGGGGEGCGEGCGDVGARRADGGVRGDGGGDDDGGDDGGDGGGDGGDGGGDGGGDVGDGGGDVGDGGDGDVASHVLSAVDEVAERVLSFLPAKTLLACSTVCRLWSCTVRRILRHRQRMEWAAVGATVSNQDPSQHALLPCLAQHLKTAWSVPRLALYLADSDSFLNSEPRTTQGRKRARMERAVRLSEELERILPSRCSVVGVAVPGVILTPAGPGSLPVEVECGPAGVCLLLPDMDGVTVRASCLQPRDAVGGDKSLRVKLQEAGLLGDPELRAVLVLCHQSRSPRLLGDPELRAVLVLCHQSRSPTVWTFCHKLLRLLEPENAVIAGGKVHSLLSPSHLVPEGGGVLCVSFSGPHVQAASVLLDTSVATPEAARATLRRLAIPGLPAGAEAAAFREVFPRTPLLGFFGEGEIGCDRISTGRYSLRQVSGGEMAAAGGGGGGGGRGANAIVHGYTSVFTLLHLGSGGGGGGANETKLCSRRHGPY